MPSMEEIYRSHADRYHELVSAEDHQGELGSTLMGLVDWNGARVLEAGVGTGRVTGYYIDRAASAVCCDRSEHMLSFAARVLAEHRDKISFRVAENTALPRLATPVDVFIEGWSFGHGVVGAEDAETVRKQTAALVSNAVENPVPGGTAIIIETMGTNTDEPAAPGWELEAFYRLLETEHGFTSRIVRTDFAFASNERAAETMGYFFGDDMERGVRARGTAVIPEFTGIWWKRL